MINNADFTLLLNSLVPKPLRNTQHSWLFSNIYVPYMQLFGGL